VSLASIGHHRPWIAWFAGILAILSVQITGWAQATQPVVPAIPPGKHENQPLRFDRAAGPASRPVQQAGSDGAFNFGQVFMAMGVVVGLILLLRWGGKRLFGNNLGAGSTKAITVLGRSLVTPRQHLMLVQVGRRIVVLANNGTQINTVCEITDPAEVAELVGQVRQERGDSMVKTFGALFRRQEEKYDVDVLPSAPVKMAEGMPDAEMSDTRQEISGLMDKVRLLSRQFRK
jgi:flagellar protein FliO/FliZ